MNYLKILYNQAKSLFIKQSYEPIEVDVEPVEIIDATIDEVDVEPVETIDATIDEVDVEPVETIDATIDEVDVEPSFENIKKSICEKWSYHLLPSDLMNIVIDYMNIIEDGKFDKNIRTIQTIFNNNWRLSKHIIDNKNNIIYVIAVIKNEYHIPIKILKYVYYKSWCRDNQEYLNDVCKKIILNRERNEELYNDILHNGKIDVVYKWCINYALGNYDELDMRYIFNEHNYNRRISNIMYSVLSHCYSDAPSHIHKKYYHIYRCLVIVEKNIKDMVKTSYKRFGNTRNNPEHSMFLAGLNNDIDKINDLIHNKGYNFIMELLLGAILGGHHELFDKYYNTNLNIRYLYSYAASVDDEYVLNKLPYRLTNEDLVPRTYG